MAAERDAAVSLDKQCMEGESRSDARVVRE
jgi:hypothetical protein